MLPPKQRILDAYAWSAGGWLLLALLRTSLRVAAIPRPLPAAAAVLGQVLLASLPWLLAAPAVVELASRLSWRRGHRLRATAIHLALGAAMSLLDAGWGWLVLPLAGYPMTLPAGVFYLVRLDQVLFLYLGLTGVGVALRHRRRSEEARMRGATLEGQLLQARLHVLALQLHPHFLFNTLHTVSELVHRDSRAAQAMLADLADLLRRSLDAGAVQEVSLRDELDLLEPYARIQRTRFSGLLDIGQEIQPETLNARVPRLLLQPLVENAIRHGTARRTGPGRIAVRSRIIGKTLVVEVEDDGAGLAAAAVRDGLGLGNTRARLRQLYGGEARLELRPAPIRGTEARLTVPLRYGASSRSPALAVADPQAETAIVERGMNAGRFAILVASAWLAVAVAGAQADFVAGMLLGTPEAFVSVLGPRLGESALWIVLSAPVIWVSARLAASSLHWPGVIALHLLAGLVAIGAHLGLVEGLVRPGMGGNAVATLLVTDLCVYIALAAAAHAWTSSRLAGDGRAATLRLEAELAAAQLELVRWRLRPDLIFAALRRIGELARDDPSAADELTGRLGELLRLTLQVGVAEQVPLGREIELVSVYLETVSTVSGDRHALHQSLDPDAPSVKVPGMLLLPLVEALGGTRVAIAGGLYSDRLELEVQGGTVESRFPAGVLSESRRRLFAGYGGSAALTISEAEGRHVIKLTLPVPVPAKRAVA